VLIAEGLVERVRVGSAVGRVEHHRVASSGARLGFECRHELLSHTVSAESLADHQAGHLAAWLVALDEVLDVEDAEPGDFSVQLGDDQPGRRVACDSVDSLG
jgi:hypothetical protein